MLALRLPELGFEPWPIRVGSALGAGPSGDRMSEADDATAKLGPVIRAVVAKTLQLPQRAPDVDDGVSETLRRVIEGRARLRPGEALAPWAIGIARHVAIDMLRSRRRIDKLDPETTFGELADPRPSPEDRAIEEDQRGRVKRALATLDEGPRRALELFHGEGASYDEICTRLDIPMGTVATWIARGRKALAAALKDRGNR